MRRSIGLFLTGAHFARTLGIAAAAGFLGLLPAAPAVAADAVAGALPDTVHAALQQAGLPAESLAVIVEPLSEPGAKVTPLLSQHAGRSVQPGSAMKLLTTAVALERLGPGYRSRVEMRSNAPLSKEGVLLGDLILRGEADADFDIEVLTRLLRDLRRQGVQVIAGDFVFDRSFFSPARLDLGIPPFDETPEFRYNVIPDALLLNNNLIELAMRSSTGPDGAPRLDIDMLPALEGLTLSSNMTLIDGDCKDWENGWKTPVVGITTDGFLRMVVLGTFPKECSATTHVNVVERNEYLARVLRPLWRSLGGQLMGTVREVAGAGGPNTRVLAEHRSRTLPAVVRDINKPSDNALARSLYLSLGALAPERIGAGTSAERAERVVRSWLKERDISDESLVLDNGSGLSRSERLSPRLLASVLRVMSRSLVAPEFLASLPIAGIDGTLRTRLRDSVIAGRARLKTGTLRDVVAITGYVPNADGETMLVVAMINHPAARNETARPVLDALVDWVGLQHSAPPPTWWQRLFGGSERAR